MLVLFAKSVLMGSMSPQDPTRGISVLGSNISGSGSLITKMIDSYNTLTFMEFLTGVSTVVRKRLFSSKIRSIITRLWSKSSLKSIRI